MAGPLLRVHLKEIDKKKDRKSTTQIIYIVLKDDQGNKTEPIPINTSTPAQDLPRELTGVLQGPPTEVTVKPPENGLHEEVYLETLSVETVHDRLSQPRLLAFAASENSAALDITTFPLHFSLKDRGKTFRNSALLPKDDPDPQLRKKELEEAREEYVLRTEADGKTQAYPARVKGLPSGENFSFKYLIFLGQNLLRLRLSKLWVSVRGFVKWLFGRNKHFNSLLDMYTRSVPEPGSEPDAQGILYTPRTVDYWDRDEWFGLQRLLGVDPSIIRLCTELPENISDCRETLEARRLLDGKTVDQAMREKRLFVCDLSFMEPYKEGIRGLVVTSPVAILYHNNEGDLKPVAIRLFQQEAKPRAPIFYPPENEKQKWTWVLAKMWYNLAEADYHETTSHLALTHLICETFCLATNRHLSETHPIHRLLCPHFVFLLSINKQADSTLLAENGDIDELANIGIAKGLSLAKGRLVKWRMDVEGTLPSDLKERGLLDRSVLHDKFYYRDDALAIYDVIKKYATGYISFYYESDEALQEDSEIQDWARVLATDYKVKGVPNGGHLKTREELSMMVTCIIFTGSVQHAAVNFGQYDQYGYAPNYSLQLRGEPPSDPTAAISEQEAFKAIPDRQTLFHAMEVSKLLSSRGAEALGEGLEKFIVDKRAPVVNCLEEFRSGLKEIAEKIQKRNNSEQVQKNPMLFYNYLDPSKIPNSISI